LRIHPLRTLKVAAIANAVRGILNVLIGTIVATSVCHAGYISTDIPWKSAAFAMYPATHLMPGWVTTGGHIPLMEILPAGADLLPAFGAMMAQGEDVVGYCSIEDARRRMHTVRQSVFYTGNNDPTSEMESLSELSKLER
jgi:hypothetical protein